MYNIGPPNIWEGMTWDEINEFKQKMQDLMPLVELLKNKLPPNNLRGMERDQMLTVMGYSAEEIEEMTGFKRADYPFFCARPDPDPNIKDSETLNHKSKDSQTVS